MALRGTTTAEFMLETFHLTFAPKTLKMFSTNTEPFEISTSKIGEGDHPLLSSNLKIRGKCLLAYSMLGHGQRFCVANQHYYWHDRGGLFSFHCFNVFSVVGDSVTY